MYKVLPSSGNPTRHELDCTSWFQIMRIVPSNLEARFAMKKLTRFFSVAVIAALLFLVSGKTADTQSTSVFAVRCGRLISPADGSVTQNAIIIVRGDRIEQVGPGLR